MIMCVQEARELFKNPEVTKVEDVEVCTLTTLLLSSDSCLLD